MDEATWAALTIVLTALGVVWTVLAFRRRGAANGLRALGVTLLPAAAWMTGTLRMFTEIAGSVTGWATSLVFDPRVWGGVGLAAVSALLLVVSGYLRDRQLGRAQSSGELSSGQTPASRAPAKQPRREKKAAGDAELDEIEEMLRKRGIQ